MTSRIQEYLTQHVEGFKNIGHRVALEEFILTCGTVYQGRPLPKGIRRMKIKMCYKNAYELACRGVGTYVEGFAIRGNLPIAVQHAWVVDKEGKVIDPTWDKLDGDTSYMGIPIEQEDLDRQIFKNRCYGVLASEMINIDFMNEWAKKNNKDWVFDIDKERQKRPRPVSP